MSAQIKTIRLRMKSIQNISKITKAMKMIAATKMKAEIRRMDQYIFNKRGKNFGVTAVSNVLANESYLQKKI